MSGAILSDCGRYRYSLWRTFGRAFDPPTIPAVGFIMLNPSTADATHDDATIRRCLHFAYRLGAGKMMVGNLYAWRATKTADLEKAYRDGADVNGPDNDEHIRRLIAECWVVILAWGSLDARKWAIPRARAVSKAAMLVDRAYCLGRAGDGEPRHPLMIPNATELERESPSCSRTRRS